MTLPDHRYEDSACDSQVRGERDGASKLKNKDVYQIRKDLSVPASVWARKLGVHPTTIRNVKKGISWRHLL